MWQEGWPLTLANGALVLHLGLIDESNVCNQDYYICVRSSESNVESALILCWRATSLNESSTFGEISYRELDPDKDPLTPLHIEMLAGEELPHLLQTLLVGVEHAICRIPLDELTFPSSITKFNVDRDLKAKSYGSGDTASLIDDKNASSKRVTTECNLKRRELITKNNSINKKKYAVKRISQSGSICDNESETPDDGDQIGVNNKESVDDSRSTNDYLNGNSESPPITASTLPLFCLGGSFPHIDSDEESGDDANKSQSGELNDILFIFFMHVIYSLRPRAAFAFALLLLLQLSSQLSKSNGSKCFLINESF